MPKSFDAFTFVDAGESARVSPERMRRINDALFAKVRTEGHVDTRVPDAWNPFALELTGQIRIKTAGERALEALVADGAAEVWIGGQRVAVASPGKRTRVVGQLPAGVLPVRIRYVFNAIQNELNLHLQGPGMAPPMAAPVAFETRVLDAAEHVPPDEMVSLPAGTVFEDPGLAANRNLTTGRPVTVTGGHQAPNAPERAVDGDLSNDPGWHCGSSPESLTVDLEEAQSVARVRVVTYFDGAVLPVHRVRLPRRVVLDRGRQREGQQNSRDRTWVRASLRRRGSALPAARDALQLSQSRRARE